MCAASYVDPSRKRDEILPVDLVEKITALRLEDHDSMEEVKLRLNEALSAETAQEIYDRVDFWCQSLTDSQCDRITRLKIMDRPLSDLPPSFQRLRNLKVFEINFCNVDKEHESEIFRHIPRVLSSMASLEELSILYAYPMTYLADSLQNLTNLRVLNISPTFIFGFVLPDIGDQTVLQILPRLPLLEVLILDNGLRFCNEASIEHFLCCLPELCPSLTTLNLSDNFQAYESQDLKHAGNRVFRLPFEVIPPMPLLHTLELRNTRISNKELLPRNFLTVRFPLLENLDLSSNSSCVLDLDLPPNTHMLSIKACEIFSLPAGYLQYLQYLNFLDLSTNSLCDFSFLEEEDLLYLSRFPIGKNTEKLSTNKKLYLRGFQRRVEVRLDRITPRDLSDQIHKFFIKKLVHDHPFGNDGFHTFITSDPKILQAKKISDYMIASLPKNLMEEKKAQNFSREEVLAVYTRTVAMAKEFIGEKEAEFSITQSEVETLCIISMNALNDWVTKEITARLATIPEDVFV